MGLRYIFMAIPQAPDGKFAFAVYIGPQTMSDLFAPSPSDEPSARAALSPEQALARERWMRLWHEALPNGIGGDGGAGASATANL